MLASSITIREISSLSGFSVSTVSKALNNRNGISEYTKTKIQKIAKKKNYIPNSAARALRSRKTNVIAVIVPKITSAYFNNFICEIQKETFAVGYRLLILQSFYSNEKEKECVHFLNDGSVDGILMLSNNQFKESDLKGIAFRNCMKIPFKSHEDFCIEEVKRLAYTSFEKLLTFIN
jgi:DNA-binding LacI/PurR family transcriptional regulator